MVLLSPSNNGNKFQDFLFLKQTSSTSTIMSMITGDWGMRFPYKTQGAEDQDGAKLHAMQTIQPQALSDHNPP